MAKCEMKMPDEFLEKVSRLGNKTDEIVPKVLEAGGEVVLRSVRSNLASSIGRDTKKPGRSTGQLLGALGMSKARTNRQGGHDIKIGFTEPRRDGESNAKIANILEYGRSGQPPRPFLKPAKSQSKNACIAAMERKLTEEIENV
jgi:HK97 gp10 family phage protein